MKLDKELILRTLRAANVSVVNGLAAINKSHIDRVAVVGSIGALLNVPLPNQDLNESSFVMALEHARACEVQGPGSLKACLVFTERAFRSCKFTSHVTGRSFIASDLARLITGLLESSDRNALIELAMIAGASRCVVERIPALIDSVEFINSYEFKHASKHVDDVLMDNARILVADGYVETVAEIHKVLESCSLEHDRLIICARGFSDDVLHTLAVNRARGSLIAYALTFPFDEDDANTLVDIATIAGGDVVSSLKGQLFSAVDVATLPRLSRARLRGQIFDFKGEGSNACIESVLANLKQKTSEASELTKHILERRVRRLSGASTIVRLRDGVDHLSRVEAWDVALRSITLATKGVVETNDHEAWPGRDIIPLASLAAAHELSSRLVMTLQQLNTCL